MSILKRFWNWLITKKESSVTVAATATTSTKGKTMSLKVSLKASQIAALVNKYDDLKSAVLEKYLSENTPSLEISDLTVDDSLSLSDTEISVTAGSTASVTVTSAGSSDITVSSSDESIATATYADGTLTINGVAAGSATINLSKGDASASVAVTVNAA